MMKLTKPIVGTHVIGEILGGDSFKLTSLLSISESIGALIKKNNLEELGRAIHQFEEGGFSIVVCLAESHVAIHTWPEVQFATIDIYACDYTKSNEKNAINLFDNIAGLFKPTKVIRKVIRR